MTGGVLIAPSVGKLEAIVGQHGVDLVSHGSAEVTQEWRRHYLGGFGVQLNRRILAGPVDGHEELQLAFFGPHLGYSKMEVTHGGWLKLLPSGLVDLDLRQAADSMA